MKSGRLKHWLTFEQPGESTQDSDGAIVETWIDAFATNTRMPFEIENLSGRELIAAQAVASRCTHRLSGRRRPGFTTEMRATHPNGTIYNIEAVIDDNDSGIRWVRLLCSTGVNAGGTA